MSSFTHGDIIVFLQKNKKTWYHNSYQRSNKNNYVVGQCPIVLLKVILYSYLILKKMNERITDS